MRERDAADAGRSTCSGRSLAWQADPSCRAVDVFPYALGGSLAAACAAVATVALTAAHPGIDPPSGSIPSQLRRHLPVRLAEAWRPHSVAVATVANGARRDPHYAGSSLSVSAASVAGASSRRTSPARHPGIARFRSQARMRCAEAGPYWGGLDRRAAERFESWPVPVGAERGGGEPV